MEIRKNNQLKDIPNLLRKKVKRTIFVQDIESENDSQPRDTEQEFDNINLNYDKYCYLCHKEIIPSLEEHSFFKCKTCSKYYHKDCYKEYSLKKTEKELLKNIIIANKIDIPSPQKNIPNPPTEGAEGGQTENIPPKNKLNYTKKELYGKECLMCILQNSNFCYICKKKINYEKELIIKCELCGNLMHYKCLDVPLFFIFYRELYKNMFSNNKIDGQKYKEFLLKLKEYKNTEITKDLLQSIFDQIPIKMESNFYQNSLFYICTYCKTRNLYDLQEINVYRSTSFSKVNYYNTTLNPLSKNIHKVKDSWNMNKIHEMYISSSNPYNDAKFDTEKYDSIYCTPKPVKIIKKYKYNRINNIIVKSNTNNTNNTNTNSETNNNNTTNNNNGDIMSIGNPNENDDSGSLTNTNKKEEINNNNASENNNNENATNSINNNNNDKKDENSSINNNKVSSPEEESIGELRNIVDLFEKDNLKNKENEKINEQEKEKENKDKDKENKDKENKDKDKEQINNNNKMEIENENNPENNNITQETNSNLNKDINSQNNILSENINLSEMEKQPETVTLKDQCLYLIKWDTLEYSLELDSFMESFPNFDDLVNQFNMKAKEEKKIYKNYPSQEVFLEKIKKILNSLSIREDSEYWNLLYNSFIYKKKDELMEYKTKIIDILSKLLMTDDDISIDNDNDIKVDKDDNENEYMPHILILCDNNNIKQFLFENGDINYLDLFNNKQSFFYECINFKEDLISAKNKNELNVITINNNLYLNKNREEILEREKSNKNYVIPNIVVDSINSINLTYLQDYHWDMIIFDLNHSRSLCSIREFFKKITNPLNINYKSLYYFMIEQQDHSKNKNNNNSINTIIPPIINNPIPSSSEPNNTLVNVPSLVVPGRKEASPEPIRPSVNNNINMNIQKALMRFFDLFYHKEETILLYGNYSGINQNNPYFNRANDQLQNNENNNIPLNDTNDNNINDEKENLKQVNLILNYDTNAEDSPDIDLFYFKKNFINLNFATLNYNDLFNGLIINNTKWSLNIDKTKFHYTQILASLISKYESKVFSLRNPEYNQVIMNFIPISLDKETFIQYLYIIKNKPEILLKSQENKKDLMQNILLLCSLPCCMTKYYKKYLEEYKVPIKDNINLTKIDVFYQLSRLLLYKTKGKIIILFPIHDKVYRENESVLRKIRKEIEKIFFSNINPDDKEVNIEERKKMFFCFLMDEDGLWEEIASSVNSIYPTHIIIFNMFLQNKNTGELFNNIIKHKVRHKIILYQLYINNLIEGKLTQVFYSKLNQFIEICASPLRKMKTTVYGQLTLAEKEIITISGLKKTYENELANNNLNNSYNSNDLSKLNIITSYKNLYENEKCFDGYIYIKKNSYLICTNSNNINLRFDSIYNSFIGNISYNNYDNTLVNNNINNNNSSINNSHNANNIILEDNSIGSANNNIQIYNSMLTEYKKKIFYQELDFLKNESNFDKLKTNRYDLTMGSKNENNNNTNNNNLNNINLNLNVNNNINNNQNNNNTTENNNQNNINDNSSPNTRGEEVYILNDSTDNINNQQRRKRGRKKKNNQMNNTNGINLAGNINRDNNTNNINSINNNEPIQIANDEDNEDMNSFLSDDMRSITNNNNIINDANNANNNNINNNNSNNNNNNANNNNNENNINLNQINEDSLVDNINQNDANSNHNLDSVPVNLDEITEDYSDTISENLEQQPQTQNQNQNQNQEQNNNNNNMENPENNNIDGQNNNNVEHPMDIEEPNNNEQNNQINNNGNIDNNGNNLISENDNIDKSKENNNGKTFDFIRTIASSIIHKKQTDINQNNKIINGTNNINNNNPNAINSNQNVENKNIPLQEKDIETEPIEKLINETKFESSRDRLFKIYNYLLTKGFEEKTRKLFVRCLLNYGFPLVNEFDKFYILFQMNANHLNIKNIPNKIDTKFYYELVYFVLEEDESLDYNIFVFGEERTSLIRTKLLIIRQFQSYKDLSKVMLYYVKDMQNILFAHIEPKLDESYQRVHFVLAKLLSNILTKSIKSGFLNYKSYIKDDNIIFDNIRIKKDGQTSVFNIREGISKKIFGKPLNEEEFNKVIELYYKALFSQVIKVPDNILNNDNAMR